MGEQTNAEQIPRRWELPTGYPYSEDGFLRNQAQAASWNRYAGPTPETVYVQFVPGQLYEFWPGGDVFNADGSYLGSFNLTQAPKPCRDDEHDLFWCKEGQPPTPEAPAWRRCRKCGIDLGREEAERGGVDGVFDRLERGRDERARERRP